MLVGPVLHARRFFRVPSLRDLRRGGVSRRGWVRSGVVGLLSAPIDGLGLEGDGGSVPVGQRGVTSRSRICQDCHRAREGAGGRAGTPS